MHLNRAAREYRYNSPMPSWRSRLGRLVADLWRRMQERGRLEALDHAARQDLGPHRVFAEARKLPWQL